MSRAKIPLSTTRPPQSEVSRRNDPCSDGIQSIRADMQLLLQINKRKKALEATRPRTASVTPTLNLVLTRARDTVRTLTTQFQNSTGENNDIRMLFATILQTANSLEKATGVSEGNAKHKPLPLDTSLWILKRLLPFVRTFIQAKQTLLHPIHRLPVELLTEIFLHIHKSNVDSINDLLLLRPNSGRTIPTVFILGRVSSYWRKIAQSIPTFISFVPVTNNPLPPWWRKCLTSDMIGRRGVDFLIRGYNTNPQLRNTMNGIKVTWIRSATVKEYNWAELTYYLDRGPLSRLEEINFTPPRWSFELFPIPWCLSGTLHTLIVHECIPIFTPVFHKLRKLSIIYMEDKFARDLHLQRDWRMLATFAPNLEEFSLLHRSSFPEISGISTTAKDVELDWTTIRSLASCSPGMVKMPAGRMRVRVETAVCTDRADIGGNNHRPTNSSSLMEVLWNNFFTTTGLGQRLKQLTIYGYRTWNYNLLQPLTGLRILEVEGPIGSSLMNSLSVKDSGGSVASDAPDGARSEETQEMAVACPNLERLVIRNSDLDGEALLKIISERNSSAWVLKGKVRLLKHVEIWNCPRVSTKSRQDLRLLRDQEV